MLELRSVVDGFNVILGSWIVHVAAFLTLVLVIRVPPDYGEDNPKTQNAKVIFASLVVMHFCLGAIKYVSLYLN